MDRAAARRHLVCCGKSATLGPGALTGRLDCLDGVHNYLQARQTGE